MVEEHSGGGVNRVVSCPSSDMMSVSDQPISSVRRRLFFPRFFLFRCDDLVSLFPEGEQGIGARKTTWVPTTLSSGGREGREGNRESPARL